MEIKRFIVGPLNTNCYHVFIDNQSILIDPGFEDEELLSFLNGKKIDYIIFTHYHIDHILGYHNIKKVILEGAKTIIHKNDYDFLNDPMINGAGFIGFDFEKIEDVTFFDGEEYELFSGCKLIHTPGHTPGSIVVYFEKEQIMFSGDTIFANGIGRTDLPGADAKKMISSIRKLLQYPSETKIYPGHEESTTLGKERYSLYHYCEI
ncbi:MAG: MBL fold metallo-hydrolase [Spirochaetales bacterium]|nr:MBL fold metallo-hydrolase [Spirochaetales bacterium]